MALPAQAVVLKINSAGLLTGATGVLVAGQRGAYEVDFVDGTCASVFGGCNVSLFQFNNFNAATAAAAALLRTRASQAGARLTRNTVSF